MKSRLERKVTPGTRIGGIRGCASGVGMDFVDLTMTTVVTITYNAKKRVNWIYGMLRERSTSQEKQRKKSAHLSQLNAGVCERQRKENGGNEKAPKTENVKEK